MTKGITNRIKMQELVNALNTMTFEEVTEESLKKALPNADIDFVNEIDSDLRSGIKDISIDDYIFTISQIRDKSHVPSNYVHLNKDDMYLTDYVEIWFTDSTGDEIHEFQGEGYIEKHNGNLELKVIMYVD